MREAPHDPCPDHDPHQQTRQVAGEDPEPQPRSLGPPGERARAQAKTLKEAGFVEKHRVAGSTGQAPHGSASDGDGLTHRGGLHEPEHIDPSQKRDKQQHAHSATKTPHHSRDDAPHLDMAAIRSIYAARIRHERRLDAPSTDAAASALEELDLPNTAHTIRKAEDKLAHDLPPTPQLDPDDTHTDMAARALAEASRTPKAEGRGMTEAPGAVAPSAVPHPHGSRPHH